DDWPGHQPWAVVPRTWVDEAWWWQGESGSIRCSPPGRTPSAGTTLRAKACLEVVARPGDSPEVILSAPPEVESATPDSSQRAWALGSARGASDEPVVLLALERPLPETSTPVVPIQRVRFTSLVAPPITRRQWT